MRYVVLKKPFLFIWQNMLKLDPHERFTIDDCLQNSVFETDRLRNRNSTPVPKSRRCQPLSVADGCHADPSERRNSVFCDIKDAELSQHDDCYAIVTSQQNNAVRLNNESNYVNGTKSESSTSLTLRNSSVPDVFAKPVKHDIHFLPSTREHVGDTKESNCDLDSSKPGFITLEKVDTSQNSSNNVDGCSSKGETVAASNKYLRKMNTYKQPLSDFSDSKSSVYETSFLLGTNAADRSSQKDVSVPAANVKNQAVNYVSSTQPTRLLEHDKKNNKVA